MQANLGSFAQHLQLLEWYLDLSETPSWIKHRSKSETLG